MRLLASIANYFYHNSISGRECAACGKESTSKEQSCTECGNSMFDHSITIVEGASLDTSRLINVIIVIVHAGLFLLFFIHSITFFSRDTLYWFFSAILQSFSALTAILTAVIIFRLQLNNTEIAYTLERLRSQMEYFLGVDAHTMSRKKLLVEARKATPEQRLFAKDEAQRAQSLLTRIKIAQQSNNGTKEFLRRNFNYNITVIVCSSMFLIFTEMVTKNNLDIPALSFTLFWCVQSLLSFRKMLLFLR